MQPNYSSIGQVFSAQTRYTVPLFQRPYVWTKEEQWQPLWEDVRALCDRVLDPPTHKPVAGHFLGTVVLEQLNTAAIEMPQRQVIDGQQRLTTLQLLLKAAQHALEVMGSKVDPAQQQSFGLAAGQVSQLSSNQFAARPDEQYKVWPTNDDRSQFQNVMDCTAKTGVGQQSSKMSDAYRFFRVESLAWLSGANAARRALAFSAALKDHLRLIVLDLDDNDEPQAIFETLNAHGTPLLPADLMKNWLLWEAGKQGLNANALYTGYWHQFDAEHDYWRKVVGAGHAARPRVDTFLQNWLTISTCDAIPVKHLYDRFLAYASAMASDSTDGRLELEPLMDEIQRSAERFRQIDSPTGDGPLAKSLRRLLRLDFVVFRPVLMAMLGRAGSDEDDVLQAVSSLESFLVRRMVCGMQTRGYGTLALELLKAIASVPDEQPAAGAVIAALNGPVGSVTEWPSNDGFRNNWVTKQFYGYFRRDRVLMILQAIEEYLHGQSTKTEPLLTFDFSQLTVEHIMPQSWSTHWPLPPGGDINAREASIQNIGNLTLVSGRLNPSLSNAPWNSEGGNCKRAGLAEHSKLEMNKRLLNDYQAWDEHSIHQRADELFKAAKSIWQEGPAPHQPD